MNSNKGDLEEVKDNCLGLAVFNLLFALAIILDLEWAFKLPRSFPDFSFVSITGGIPEDSSVSVWGLLLVFIAISVILKPSSLFRSIPFFVLLLISIIGRMPFIPNHHLFEGLILISILACFIYSTIKDGNNFTKRRFYELFAPVLRLELIIFYFWAAFHKLNTGFLNDDISCATMQLFNIKDIIPFLPTPDWFIYINPYLTIAVEFLIPILLIVPQTRIYGLVLGFCFHFILGIQYPGFTLLVYSLLSLFIPSSSYDRIKTYADKLRDKISGGFSGIGVSKYWEGTRLGNAITNVVLISLIFFILRFFMSDVEKTSFLSSREGLYLIFCVIWGFVFFYFVLIRLKSLKLDREMMLVPKKKWLLIFPAIVFLNGLLPYIGIRNIHAWAMFSNLRTEAGRTNHLLVPYSFQLFDNLNDLVSIKRSNQISLQQFSRNAMRQRRTLTSLLIPKYYVEYKKDEIKHFWIRLNFKVPFVMLQNMVTLMAKGGVRDIKLAYERGGEIIYTKNAELDPNLSSASTIQLMFLSQRAVPNDERGLCMW